MSYLRHSRSQLGVVPDRRLLDNSTSCLEANIAHNDTASRECGSGASCNILGELAAALRRDQ